MIIRFSNKFQKNQNKYNKSFELFACLFITGFFWILVSIYFTPFASAINYNNRILESTDFSRQDLTDSSFDHANLRKSDFSNSNLQGVRFFSANLSRSNFTGSNMRYSDLESARLTNANLTNAILEGAFCTNTLFDGSIINGADFTDVYFRTSVRNKLCEVAKGNNPTTGRKTRDTLMCP